MSCPTCSHTMQSLGHSTEGFDWFWCPRCGTIGDRKLDRAIMPDVPKLVTYCQRYERLVELEGEAFYQAWHAGGIMESIHPEGER